MPRLTFFVLAILIGPTSLASNLFAWQENIEDVIEQNSAGFVVIEDPVAILDQIEGSVFFENRYYLKAMEILNEEQFSLISEARLLDFERQWYELRDAIARLDEISIIIHSWEDDFFGPPKISIVLSGDDDVREHIQLAFSAFKSLIAGTASEGADTGEEEAEEEKEEFDFFSHLGKGLLEKLVVRQTDDLFLISNTTDELEKLVQRIESSPEKKFRSLSKNRSYQQIQNILDKRAESPQIRGYISPKRFSVLVSQLIQPDIWRMPSDTSLTSLSGAGFQILLQHESNTIETLDGNFQPIINWDFVTVYTQPATEYGKLIESFQPLELIPPLPFKITSLSAEGFNFAERHQTKEEIHERILRNIARRAKENGNENTESDPDDFGPDSDERLLAEFGIYFLGDDFDTSKIINASKGKIEVYHEENTSVWEDGIHLYRVNEKEAMTNILMEMVSEENSLSEESAWLEEFENEHGRHFARSEAAIRAHLESIGSQDEYEIPDTGPLGDEIMAGQYEFFMNDDWLVKADHISMLRFFKTLNEVPEPGPFELLLENSREASGQDSFFKIAYRSHTSFENILEEQRIWDKILDTHRADDASQDKFHLAYQKIFQRLDSEPDEFGLRIKLESKEDANAAVQQLLLNAFTDTFGTVISLYSQDEHRMRIFGQVYSYTE